MQRDAQDVQSPREACDERWGDLRTCAVARVRETGVVKLDDVRAIQYGDVLVEGERWPNSIHVIEHPDGRVLVDTGMIDSTPELDASESGQLLTSLRPRRIWLAHRAEPRDLA